MTNDFKLVTLILIDLFNMGETYFDSRYQTNTSLGPIQNVLFGNGKFIDTYHVSKLKFM